MTFLVLAFVLLAAIGRCLVKNEYIPTFLFILIHGLAAVIKITKLQQATMLTGTLFPLLFAVVLLRNLMLKKILPMTNFVFLIMYILLVILSGVMNGADLDLYRANLALLVLPFIVALCPNNEKTVRYLTVAIALWGVANLGAVIMELSGIGLELSSKNYNTTNRVNGLMGHPTLMGIYFAISLCAVQVLVLQAKKKFGRALWLLVGVGMVIGLAETLSRGAFGGWLLASLFIQYKLCGFRISNMKGVVIAAVLVISISVFLGLGTMMVDRFSNMGEEASAQERIPLLKMGMSRLEISPIFGIGINQRGNVHLEAHNTYMQVLMETGIVGFMVFCLVLWRCIRGFMLHIRPNAMNGSSAPYFVGLLGMVIAILFDGITHVFDYLLLLWLLMGIGFMPARKQ